MKHQVKLEEKKKVAEYYHRKTVQNAFIRMLEQIVRKEEWMRSTTGEVEKMERKDGEKKHTQGS